MGGRDKSWEVVAGHGRHMRHAHEESLDHKDRAAAARRQAPRTTLVALGRRGARDDCAAGGAAQIGGICSGHVCGEPRPTPDKPLDQPPLLVDDVGQIDLGPREVRASLGTDLPSEIGSRLEGDQRQIDLGLREARAASSHLAPPRVFGEPDAIRGNQKQSRAIRSSHLPPPHVFGESDAQRPCVEASAESDEVHAARGGRRPPAVGSMHPDVRGLRSRLRRRPLLAIDQVGDGGVEEARAAGDGVVVPRWEEEAKRA